MVGEKVAHGQERTRLGDIVDDDEAAGRRIAVRPKTGRRRRIRNRRLPSTSTSPALMSCPSIPAKNAVESERIEAKDALQIRVPRREGRGEARLVEGPHRVQRPRFRWPGAPTCADLDGAAMVGADLEDVPGSGVADEGVGQGLRRGRRQRPPGDWGFGEPPRPRAETPARRRSPVSGSAGLLEISDGKRRIDGDGQRSSPAAPAGAARQRRLPARAETDSPAAPRRPARESASPGSGVEGCPPPRAGGWWMWRSFDPERDFEGREGVGRNDAIAFSERLQRRVSYRAERPPRAGSRSPRSSASPIADPPPCAPASATATSA